MATPNFHVVLHQFQFNLQKEINILLNIVCIFSFSSSSSSSFDLDTKNIVADVREINFIDYLRKIIC